MKTYGVSNVLSSGHWKMFSVPNDEGWSRGDVGGSSSETGDAGDGSSSSWVEWRTEGGGAGGVDGGSLRTRVFQQSVTLTASMWPGANDTSSAGGGAGLGLWGIWRVPSERVPLLVGIFCGGALVVFLLLTVLIYKCCIMPRRQKHYYGSDVDDDGAGMRKCEPEGHAVNAGAPPMYPSHSAVFADPKSGQLTYSSRLISPVPGSSSGRPHWFYNNRIVGASIQQCTQCPSTCPVPRSTSNPGPGANNSQQHQQASINTSQRRQRPVSQPIRFGPCDLVANGEVQKKIPMPEISEFCPQNVQYASSSILDEVGTKDELPDQSGTTSLKTRSLPAWVRSKPRPLSTEDDLADLYAKVNFSKKRKNRMRNDEAAIIALSKSRSQFLHKDTDSLVDNEAVIVYDERTAL